MPDSLHSPKPRGPERTNALLNRSLTEFLDLLELRSQGWELFELAEDWGFRTAGTPVLNVYAMISGSARITTTVGRSLEMTQGDVVFVLPGAAHRIAHASFRQAPPPAVAEGNNPDEKLKRTHAGRGPTVAQLLCGSLEAIWPGGVYPNRAPKLLSIRPELHGIDLPAFVQAADGLSHAAVLDQMATLLFVLAFRDHPRCRAQFRWDLSDPIVRARVLIEKHPFRQWSVVKLATEVGMGRSNFAARFAQQTGATPMEALAAERMRQTAFLLKDSRLKIGEICERVGYRSEAAFIRRFTAHFGMTPSEWRRVHAAT